MSGVAAVILGQVQEVKARSLQTLMAVLDEITLTAGSCPITPRAIRPVPRPKRQTA